MCKDMEEAKRNLENVKAGLGNAFYDRQWELIHYWRWGCRVPRGLKLGELPRSDILKRMGVSCEVCDIEMHNPGG